MLTFDDEIYAALKKACDHDNDAMHLARAARRKCLTGSSLLPVHSVSMTVIHILCWLV